MPKILIINGPNLNLLGTREPEVYGHVSMDEYLRALSVDYPGVEIDYYQSNHEGDLIDRIQEVGFDSDYAGIVLNAGAYTHTSLALADAIRAIDIPVVEVHISNTAARPEAIRHTSLIAPACRGTITGFGMDSYRLGIESLL
jgi:dehydroquinase class II